MVNRGKATPQCNIRATSIRINVYSTAKESRFVTAEQRPQRYNSANIMRILFAPRKIPMISKSSYFRDREKGKRCTAPSSGHIGRNFQIELELGASKADTTQVSPAGLAGK